MIHQVASLDMNRVVGAFDIVLITLDTLRYDVAQLCFDQGRIPNLSRYLPSSGWERRHSPGSFTYSTHHAVFAGFLPTPTLPGPHPRLFAARFAGSETTTAETFVFDDATWIGGLRQQAYHTICIGGVGFFNQQTALCKVLPDLFDESHWSPALGVTSSASTELQVELAIRRMAERPLDERLCLFINISAIHQPNCLFGNHDEDSCETQAEALAYVDRCLPRLFDALSLRGQSLCLLFSDHGTAYGEDGYEGHRLAHPVVWDVPYTHFLLNSDGGEFDNA